MEGKLGRITFDDRTFQQLINGETLKLDISPNTVHLEIKLDDRSRFRKRYEEILEELRGSVPHLAGTRFPRA